MDDVIPRLNTALQGHYTLLEEIGHGGMAVVYLAEDLKHHRKVVLKVLRSELAAVLGAERFLKEIEVTANLQHPNILQLYDSGEADGLLYYVMPLVEGESLRQKLDREQQLPVEEAVEIARSVAAALDYAHRHGVIHRDIKPSNIMLHEGQALVADFGIALAMRKAGGETRLTETGLSVGTPHYMSPEQAAGDREVDARSDIYSLGATTYEMLVGEPPYVAKTPQAVVAKILFDTPVPIRSTRELVPINVEAAVAKALARTPADRFTSGAEFAAALTNPSFTVPALSAATGGHAAARVGIWARLALGLAAVCVASLGLALWGWLRPEAPKQVARYNLAMLPGQEFLDDASRRFALARGAAFIVYLGPGEPGGANRLWVKAKGQLEAHPLPGTEGAYSPAISPDGSEVVFHSPPQLRKVSLHGGAPVTVADTGSNATWLADGSLVYVKGSHLRRIPASGGAWEELWPEQPKDRWASYPTALPDARGVLFTLCDSACVRVMDAWVLDLRSGKARQVVTEAVQAWYLDAGYIVFVRRDGAVFTLPFDIGALEPTGTAVPLLQGVRINQNGTPNMAVSSDGSLLMPLGTPTAGAYEMVWVSRRGEIKQVDAGWRFNNSRNRGWALSPDGKRLAVGIHTDEGDDIWVKELDDGPLVRLTHDPAEDARPEWTPDGGSVYFVSGQAGRLLLIQQADGSGSPRPLVGASHISRGIFQLDLSPDGTWLLARGGGVGGLTGGRDIFGYRLDQDTTEVPLLVSEYDEVSPQLSPDGRWLAYVSQEAGEWEVYVRPFPDVNAGKWAVSRRGGYGPRWAHSGRELFYVSADSVLMVATVQGGSGFRVSDRRALFKLPDDIATAALLHPFDIAPDDQRFIMQRWVGSGAPDRAVTVVLIENWAEEVKQKVGAQGR